MAVEAIPPILLFLSLAVVAKSKAYQKLADTIGRLPFLFMISLLLISTSVITVVSVNACSKFVQPQIKRVFYRYSNDIWLAWWVKYSASKWFCWCIVGIMIRLALTLPLFACETHYMPRLDYYMRCVVLGVNFFYGSIILTIIMSVLSNIYPKIFSHSVASNILVILLCLLLLFGGVIVLSLARWLESLITYILGLNAQLGMLRVSSLQLLYAHWIPQHWCRSTASAT